MDPISVIVLALIYAALKAPGEAGRSVRSDYRGRRDRWGTRAENWSTGRGRGGRRVAGYDRDGRAYRSADRNRRNGKRRGDPGWRTDPGAWTGPEGRARVARGLRPRALRSGIVAGALAYTAVFGLGVASHGFARGLRGGYQMGRLHYLGKRNQAQDPTATVTPGQPGGQPGPQDEVVDAVIVEDPNTEPPADAPAPGPGAPPESEPRPGQGPDAPEREAIRPPAPDGWLITVYAPGSSVPVDEFTLFHPDEVDARLARIGQIPGLRAEVRPFADLPEWARPDLDETGPTAPDSRDTAPAPQDSRPQTATGPTIHPGGTSMSDNVTGSTPVGPARAKQAAPINTTAGQFVPVGASISAPVLMEGANYHAHLHNLNVIAKEAQHEYTSAELTLASASAARQRAEYSMAAVEQMAVGLAAQDFGDVHVGNMASLHELLARHVEHARTAENAARESLATSEQLIEMCLATAAAFQRDHGQLAEAHASAPHAAKTREAYQPM